MSLSHEIVASSSDAIIAVTPDAIITHWNPAAERIFAYRADEIIGKSLFIIVPPDAIQHCRDMMAALNAGGSIASYVTQRLRKDGKLLDVSINLSRITDDAGELRGYSAFVRDIGQQKRLEAEVVHAQKMEAVGLLAGGVAHDLNNLLTSIMVGLEIAEHSSEVDATTRESFHDMRMACFDSARLIRQLLAVAKRQVINPVACSVNGAIEEMIPLLRGLLGRGIEIVARLEATRGVFVDPSQLNQIILNLAANARDAMPNGGTFVLATADDPVADCVSITVTDTGCGMSAEIQARAFEPFFTTKHASDRPGLGLSTTYGIVVQSGGTISLSSAPGAGTTFTISLPAVQEPMIDPRAALHDRGARPGLDDWRKAWGGRHLSELNHVE